MAELCDAVACFKVEVFGILNSFLIYKKMKTRLEHDSLGEIQVPADAYYGVQTLRAMINFKDIFKLPSLSRYRISRNL